MIQAVTFDFWETLYTDPSDIEETRKTQRLKILEQFITSKCAPANEQTICSKYDMAKNKLNVWSQATGKTFKLIDIVTDALTNLGFDIMEHYAEIDQLVDQMDRLCLDYPPVLMENAQQTVSNLAQHYKLGLISNTGETSGKVLRGLLARDRILKHFLKLSFSDEMGIMKPSPHIFYHTIDYLDVAANQTVHIGNELRSDVHGAMKAGLHAILISTEIKASSDGFIALEDLSSVPAAVQTIKSH